VAETEILKRALTAKTFFLLFQSRLHVKQNTKIFGEPFFYHTHMA